MSSQVQNDMEGTEVMTSLAPGLVLGVLSKVSQ